MSTNTVAVLGTPEAIVALGGGGITVDTETDEGSGVVADGVHQAPKGYNRLTDMGKRFDAVGMDPREIIVETDFNPRDFNLPDNIASIQDMKAQIIAAGGIQQALWVRLDGAKDDKKAYLIDGERRLRAALELLSEETHADLVKRVPVIQKSLGVTKPGERLILALTANEGKRLSPFEAGKTYERLIKGGYTVEEIATKTGKSEKYIREATALVNAPEEVQALVKAGEVTQSAAIRAVKDQGTDAAAESLQAAVNERKADGKKGPVKAAKTDTKLSKLKQIALVLEEWSTTEYESMKKEQLYDWLEAIDAIMDGGEVYDKKNSK